MPCTNTMTAKRDVLIAFFGNMTLDDLLKGDCRTESKERGDGRWGVA